MTVSVTLMLPRVAFEYGQKSWASSSSSRAVSGSTPGMWAFSSTARPTPPSSAGPNDTSAVTVESEVSMPRVFARLASAPSSPRG